MIDEWWSGRERSRIRSAQPAHPRAALSLHTTSPVNVTDKEPVIKSSLVQSYSTVFHRFQKFQQPNQAHSETMNADSADRLEVSVSLKGGRDAGPNSNPCSWKNPIRIPYKNWILDFSLFPLLSSLIFSLSLSLFFPQVPPFPFAHCQTFYSSTSNKSLFHCQPISNRSYETHLHSLLTNY